MTLLQHYKNYLILFILILVVLFIRIGDINFTEGRYLWAEDGNVFINQSFSLGWESITKPHVGYILLYPRLVSLFAIQFDLSFLPTIFFLAWIGAVLFSGFVIFKWIYKNTGSSVVAMIIPLLVLLQPHSGETFFSITNAQWFLAIALIILLIDKDYKLTLSNLPILILLGLTGPFSILVLPVLFLNIVLKRDIKENYLKYSLILVAAFVQIYFMTQSNRIGGTIDTSINHWLKSFYVFVTFGTKGVIALISLALWSIVFVYIVKIFCNACQKKLTANQINGLLLFMGLMIFYFAGLWSSKRAPLLLHPLDLGARYFVIPYALLIINLPLLIKNKKILAFVFSLVLVIEIAQINKGQYFNKPDLNYSSFVWFSTYASDLTIPINPQWRIYPGWHISLKNSNKGYAKAININLDNIQYFNAAYRNGILSSTNNQVIFNLPQNCYASNHIGIEIDLTRTKEGWSRIFYADSKNSFSAKNSLGRYYPEGNITMQFAFKNNNVKTVRLVDATEQKEELKIHNIRVYCEEK